MADIKTIFGAINHLDTYQRVNSTHLLDLYVGNDDTARWTLLLISEYPPMKVASSRMILVKSGRRSDKKWSLSFSLVDDSYRDMFVLFCEDIIASSACISNKEKATRFVGKRYKEWREMLANAHDSLLSPEEIKGLLGEMYFLKVFLCTRYGAKEAALSWTGPRHLPQDYIIDDTWYEVKTVSSSRAEVTISSIEQLDCVKPGELVVIRADKTSVTNTDAVNLNTLYRELLAMLSDDDAREQFSTMLLHYGYYPRPEYEEEEYTFEIKATTRYAVSTDFPCIRRTNLPESITEAKYSLSLATIDSYRRE
nr:PD-(D/E)XK motif protein [uncultured Oscillibacter sp.]